MNARPSSALLSTAVSHPCMIGVHPVATASQIWDSPTGKPPDFCQDHKALQSGLPHSVREVAGIKALTSRICTEARRPCRTCLYLTSCCSYLAEPDDAAVLRTAYDIYLQRGKYPDAMRVALRLNGQQLIVSCMRSTTQRDARRHT